jgi:hypothetical protein
MKKVCLSLLAIGVLAFGIVFSPANGPTMQSANEAEQQNLPIQPPV